MRVPFPSVLVQASKTVAINKLVALPIFSELPRPPRTACFFLIRLDAFHLQNPTIWAGTITLGSFRTRL